MKRNVITKLWSPVDFTWPYKLALAIACAAAAMDVVSVAYNSGYLACSNSSASLSCMGFMDRHGTYLSYINAIRAEITGGLLLSVIGIYLKRHSGLLISALGLIAVLLIYAHWYQKTIADMRELEVPSFNQLQGSGFQRMIPLRYGTWLDVIILGAAAVLLVWHIVAGINRWPTTKADDL